MTGLFTNGTTLSATALNDAINSLTLNAQTGTTYTFVLADAGKLVTASNASAQTYTIPLNASVAYATGTIIELLNISTGTVTLSPTGGVTLTGSTSIGPGTRVRLTKTATNTWYVNTLGGGGLTLVASGTAAAVAKLSVNGCFSSAYDNYLIVGFMAGSTAVDLSLRLRAAGVDASAGNYDEAGATLSTVYAGYNSTSDAAFRVTSLGTPAAPLRLELTRPALAATTGYLAMSFRTNDKPAQITSGVHALGTAYDGFSLIASTGNITGTVRVYGYQNS